MKEIKFKGKTYQGKWIYGYCYKVKSLFDSNIFNWFIRNDYEKDEMIIPETLSQYTGLKDKNGVEIYEGDIIKTYANYGYGKNTKQVEVISEVIYKVDEEKTMGGLNSNSFSGFKTKQLNNQEYTNVDWSMFFQCEIIGNIYEDLKESGE